MIALDDNGNFVTDGAGHLTVTATPLIQCAKSELRCQQGEWISDFFFGRNVLVWGISQSTHDRAVDINRIVSKYVAVISVTYDELTKTYNVQVASNA